MTRLLLAALFLEMGLALVVIPWSVYWDRNLFVDMMPAVRDLLASNYVRGAVSGLGVVNLAAGGAEVHGLIARRRDASVSSPVTSIVKDA